MTDGLASHSSGVVIFVLVTCFILVTKTFEKSDIRKGGFILSNIMSVQAILWGRHGGGSVR